MEVLRHLRPRGLVTTGRARLRAAAAAALLSVAVGACASAQRAAPLAPAVAGPQWPVKVREHVDLWLHGFAMLQEDTATVPLFDRGYRDRLTVARNVRGIVTDLDANRETLARALATRPALLGAQFLALYFGSWDEMVRAFEYFQAAGGDPRRSGNREVQGIIAFLAQQFPTPEDREFARLLVLALRHEHERFHHAWWLEEQRARAAGLAAADSLWQSRWRPALQRYLNHTQQGNGDILVTIALGGEGRALPAGKTASQYAVAWPRTADSAEVMLFAFAHEAAGAISEVAVNDNLTPVQQREGLGSRYSTIGLVRGGALLVERVDPALAERYARWYLALAGRPVPATGALDALAEAFPMPDEMIASMRRQIEISFGGI
jgi:hypothetical protein